MNFSSSIRHIALGAIVLAASLTVYANQSSAAPVATAEQRAACTPDAFRLCASEIPNIPAITACMRKNKENLSTACKAVFDK